MGMTMAIHLQHIVITYGMAYAAHRSTPCQSRRQVYLLRELHPGHETTYKTKGTMSMLLCFVKTSLFINIKDMGWY